MMRQISYIVPEIEELVVHLLVLTGNNDIKK
jgi:hypothetical protein